MADLIQFEDKVNNPELLAFLQQYGDNEYLTAVQINQIRDAINLLNSNKFNKPNGSTSQYIRGDGSLAPFPQILPTLTSGSVLFSDGNTIAEDNISFFWDKVNKRLGIGTKIPYQRLSVNGNVELKGAAGTRRAIITDETTAGTGVVTIQGGAGSASFGGAINLYGNAHPSYPGGVSIGLSANNQNANFRVNGSAFDGDTDFFTVKRNGNVGIGIDPTARLSIKSQSQTDICFVIRNHEDTSDLLKVNGYGNVWSSGLTNNNTNTFFGSSTARNMTTAAWNNTGFGNGVLNKTTTGGNNTAIGANAMYYNTTGIDNTALGIDVLRQNTTGRYNSGIGAGVLTNNTTGYYNNVIGNRSMEVNTTGGANCVLGSRAMMFNIVGNYNVSIGYQAMQKNLSDENIGIGFNAMFYNENGVENIGIGSLAGGEAVSEQNTNSNKSIFIGPYSKAQANNQTNQIVIGHQAIGKGSNTIQLGNSSIEKTYLQGQVITGIFASAPTGIEGAFYYDSTIKKHRGFNGTSWFDLY